MSVTAELACHFITKGSTPQDVGGNKAGRPFLKVYNIVDNKIDFHYRPQFISLKSHKGMLRRSVVYPGDVLMNIVGPPLGKIAIVPADYPEWNINQALAIFRPVASVDGEFFRIALLGSVSLRQIIGETRGVVGQSNISLEQCRSLAIGIPSLAEQREIVRRVSALLTMIDTIETRVAATAAHADGLTEAIREKAFRGELVTTEAELARTEGRDYEPASVLLERIRARKPGHDQYSPEPGRTSGRNGRPARTNSTRGPVGPSRHSAQRAQSARARRDTHR